MVVKVVTHLAMQRPDQLRPATQGTQPSLERVSDPVGGDRQRILGLHDRIAIPHHWSGLVRTEDEWTAVLSRDRRRHLIARLHGEDVGWACLTTDTDGGVRIRSFGLVPEVTGSGMGGPFLTDVVRAAWDLAAEEGAAGPVRLWTSTWDHPRALQNYLVRGFEVVDREVHSRTPGAATWTTRTSMPDVLVRPAVADDAQPVVELLDHLGYHAEVEVVRQRLASRASSMDDSVAVAVPSAGGRPLGVVAAHVVPLLAESTDGFVRITALSVAPSAARQGVGRQLVEFVEDVARQRGLELLEVSSGRRPERDDAQRFYPAVGFHDTSAEAVRYWKPLT